MRVAKRRGILVLTVLPVMFAIAMVTRGFYINRYCGWQMVTSEADFSPRDTAAGFVLNGSLYLSNGYYHGHQLSRDLWKSSDGRDWSLVSDTTPYDGYSPITRLNGKLLAAHESAWVSDDGSNWSKVSDEVPADVTTGIGEMATLNDAAYYVTRSTVSRTTDGASWEILTEDAPFGLRMAGMLVTFQDQLIYLGGAVDLGEASGELGYDTYRSFADVWASRNGKDWHLLTDAAGWDRRMWPTVIEHEGHLWLFGRFSNVNNTNLGDLWVSSDGKRWREVDLALGPSARHFSTAFSRPDGFLIVAGNSWPVLNDVWLFRPPPLGWFDERFVQLYSVVRDRYRDFAERFRQR